MKKLKKTSLQPRRLIILLGVMILLGVFLMGMVSARDYEKIKKDNVNQVSEYLQSDFNNKYGVIKISKTFLGIEIDKLVEYSLIDNTEACLIDCEARGKAVLYKDGKLFQNVNFKNKFGIESFINSQFYIKKIKTYTAYDYTETPTSCINDSEKDCKTLTISNPHEVIEEYWAPYNFEELEKGNYEWKLIGTKSIHQNLDFIPTSNDVQLSDWAWWNSSWLAKAEIVVKENLGRTIPLTNYSVLITVTYQSSMNSDFSDLRFVNGSENEELKYYIESKVDGSSASVWVKVPELVMGGNQTIYMYYGNPSATTTSDRKTAFLYFEDFSTNPFNITWNCNNVEGTNCIYNVTDQSVIIASYTGFGNAFMNYFVEPFSDVEYSATQWNSATDYWAALYTSNDTNGSSAAYRRNRLLDILSVQYNPDYMQLNGYWENNTGMAFEYLKMPSDGYWVAKHNVSIYWFNFSTTASTIGSAGGNYTTPRLKNMSTQTGTYFDNSYIYLWDRSTSLVMFDDVRVRRFVSPEPTVFPITYMDVDAPQYSYASVNNTFPGEPTVFSIFVNDDVALNPNGQYIFSTNNSGIWINDTAVNFTTPSSWANVTKILNNTNGTIVGYRWYLTDNSIKSNSTPIYTMMVYSSLSIDLVSPPNNYFGLNYINFTCSAQETNTTITHMQKWYYITNLNLWTNASGTWKIDDYYALTRNANNSFNGTYDRYTNPGDTWGTTTYTWDYDDETPDTVHWVNTGGVIGTQGLFFASPNQVIDWVYINVTSWESTTAGIYPTPTSAHIEIYDGNTWIDVPQTITDILSWGSLTSATFHWRFWGNLNITNASGIRVYMTSTSGDGNNDPTYQVYSLEYGRNNITTMNATSSNKDDYFKQNYTKSFYRNVGGTTSNFLWNCEVSRSDTLKTENKSLFVITNRSVSVPVVVNSINYTPTVYETQITSYWINVSGFLDSARLYINGTPYSATQSGNIWNITKSVYSSEIGNASLIWGLTYLGTELNITAQYQTILPIQFGLCNATLTTPAYLNFTFKDESNLSSITGIIPSSIFYYYLGDGTVIKQYQYLTAVQNSSFAFCFIPINKTLYMNYTLQYSSSGYPQRSYDTSIQSYINTTTNVTLYLLGAGNGQYVTFITSTTINVPIYNVEVTITRDIGGTQVIIANGFTDNSGVFTAWLNPNYPHTITATKTGYTTNIQTITPTQTLYTLIMSGTEEEYIFNNTIAGLKWYSFPATGTIKENSSTFGFNVSARDSNLVACRFDLLNADKSITLDSATTNTSNPSVCYVSLTFARNETYTAVKGRLLVDVGNGGWTLLEEDAYWKFITINSTGSTFTDWITGLSFLELSYFNNDEQHREYTYILIFFLVVMIICASLNLFGWDVQTAGGMIFLVGILVIIASVPGLLTLSYISPFAWLDKYFVAIIYTMFMIGFAGRELI